ncbi:MAG: hypothetical protein EOM63_01490 [Clostridia bacterium]|nr:hypothetical protein [Clostridia bacterium]
MDFDALVNEIVARVAAKLEENEGTASTVVSDDKPRLLILTQQHGDFCHTMLESARLGEYYHTECALLQDYDCDPASYEAVILFGLTNEALGKLAGGVCDTPFTTLAQKLILAGKKIFVPAEEIELFQYEQTAPPAYYAMMESKLTFLKSAGFTVCPKAQLESAILGGESTAAAVALSGAAPAPMAPAPVPIPVVETASATPVEATVSKRVVSEKDMIAACRPGVTVLRVQHNAIITDLARDYAKMRRIEIIRD